MKLFKKRPVHSAMLAVTLLGVMFGTQCAVLAHEVQDPGGMPYSFDFGFNIGANSTEAGLSAADVSANIVGGCHNAFGGGASFNECVFGGQAGVKAALGLS